MASTVADCSCWLANHRSMKQLLDGSPAQWLLPAAFSRREFLHVILSASTWVFQTAWVLAAISRLYWIVWKCIDPHRYAWPLALPWPECSFILLHPGTSHFIFSHVDCVAVFLACLRLNLSGCWLPTTCIAVGFCNNSQQTRHSNVATICIFCYNVYALHCCI